MQCRRYTNLQLAGDSSAVGVPAGDGHMFTGVIATLGVEATLDTSEEQERHGRRGGASGHVTARRCDAASDGVTNVWKAEAPSHGGEPLAHVVCTPVWPGGPATLAADDARRKSMGCPFGWYTLQGEDGQEFTGVISVEGVDPPLGAPQTWGLCTVGGRGHVCVRHSVRAACAGVPTKRGSEQGVLTWDGGGDELLACMHPSTTTASAELAATEQRWNNCAA